MLTCTHICVDLSMRMSMYVHTCTHTTYLYVLNDYVQRCEDTVSIELSYVNYIIFFTVVVDVVAVVVVAVIITIIIGATRGVAVSMSAFLACHQCYCAGSSFAWGLNLRAVVCGIF